jgi:hypothetical protein
MRTFGYLLIACFLLSMAGTALGETISAHCEVKVRGDLQKKKTGACSFSQEDGYYSIELVNGERHELKPGSKKNRYTDGQDRKVERRNKDNGVQFVWPHWNIMVRY